jgi:hypothetical protein
MPIFTRRCSKSHFNTLKQELLTKSCRKQQSHQPLSMLQVSGSTYPGSTVLPIRERLKGSPS